MSAVFHLLTILENAANPADAHLASAHLAGAHPAHSENTV
jgi:hypothetical protein